mgnify:CR=1 FL=1
MIFFDLKIGPIISNNFPPKLDDTLGPKILNIEKKITTKHQKSLILRRENANPEKNAISLCVFDT